MYVIKLKSQVKYMLSQEDLFAKALMVEELWFVDKVQFDKAAKAKARGYKRADTIKAINKDNVFDKQLCASFVAVASSLCIVIFSW
jgi:hypothetical protein